MHNNDGPAKVRERIEEAFERPTRAWVNHNVDGRGRRPLHYAAQHGLDDLVERLLAIGADPNLGTDGGFGDLVGETPLHFACEHAGPSTVALLIAGGANPNETRAVLRPRGVRQSCATIAAERGSVELVERLLSAGANPDGEPRGWRGGDP